MDKQISVYEPTEQVKMEVKTDGETVWLTIDQMAMLFGRDKSVIGKHVRNVFAEGGLPEEDFRQILPKISVVGGRPSALARNPAKPRLRPTVGQSSWFETRKSWAQGYLFNRQQRKRAAAKTAVCDIIRIHSRLCKNVSLLYNTMYL